MIELKPAEKWERIIFEVLKYVVLAGVGFLAAKLKLKEGYEINDMAIDLTPILQGDHRAFSVAGHTEAHPLDSGADDRTAAGDASGRGISRPYTPA